MKESSPATIAVVAGVAAVLHRRTGQDLVRVLLGRRGDGVLALAVEDGLTLGDLMERAGAEPDRFEPKAGYADISAVVGHGRPQPPVPEHVPVVCVRPEGGSFTVTIGAEPHAGDAFAAQVRRAMGADRSCAIGLLDLMTAEESTRLAAMVGSGRAVLPPRCVHELVAQQAARTPDAVAVSGGARELSYRRLDRWADELAAELRAAGAGPGSIVSVLLHRSPELVVALLAVLKTGGAYLALEPEDSATRGAALARDAGSHLIVVEESLRERVPDGLGTVVLREIHPTGDAAPPAEPGHPESPAYVCYTSGSTGEPRGVLVPHRAISRLVRDPAWIDIRRDDVFLQLAPVAFDASTFEIWAPLVNGCRLAVFPSGPLDLMEVAKSLEADRVTVLWLTAGLFHQMVAHHLPAFHGLRHLIAGGDVVCPTHVERLLAAHPRLAFTNGYGPTENTTFTTCWTTRTAPAKARVPIGRPIDGTRVSVLDAGLRPVPSEVRGELWAAGEGVALAYVNKAAATAERFVPDPFATEPGGRMYRTGDIVSWAPDGTLEFLGRADQQVKIRGFRVELGAVETELARHPDVQQAVVVAQRHDGGDPRLIAYAAARDVPAEDWHTLSVRLRERLHAVLPAYQVPWAIIVRPDLPLTQNGKVDRRALPTATRLPRNVWNDYVMPRDGLEQRLAEIWGEVLGIEPVGVEDDFFDIGGHSMLAAGLVELLQREFGTELSARTLYLKPTISDLAAELAEPAGSVR